LSQFSGISLTRPSAPAHTTCRIGLNLDDVIPWGEKCPLCWRRYG